VVLCLSQDGACKDSFENFRENSLKGDLSNDITLNPPLFSLVNTFKRAFFKVKKFFGLPSSLNYKTKQFMSLFAGFPSNYSYQRDDSSSLSAWVFCPFCLGTPSQCGTRKPYYKQKRYSEFK
jgi:hypothetical protein